jgi:benzoyl-CoA reductase subunit C
VGYVCTFFPEEILYAAGIVLIRILGGHTPRSVALAQSYIFDMYCPFGRDCLSTRIAGGY